jgi:hypothetical protein
MTNMIGIWDESLYGCISDSSTHRHFPEHRVKKCKDIINLINFSRQYVMTILTTKKWIQVKERDYGMISTKIQYSPPTPLLL